MYSKITNPRTGRKVNINGRVGRKILNQYINALQGGENPVAFMVFGRFQPPHNSHTELIDYVIAAAQEENGAAFLFTSKKDNDFEDPKKLRSYKNSRTESAKKKKAENPLKINDKLDILYKLHGDKDITIVDVVSENISNPFDAIHWLDEKNFSKIVLYAGTDRYNGYKRSFEKYDYVEVRELERPEDGISGTEVREIALDSIIEYTDKLDQLREISDEISVEELNQIEHLVTLYGKIKGKDRCFKGLDKILSVLKLTKDDNCTEDINLIRHIVTLIRDGTLV